MSVDQTNVIDIISTTLDGKVMLTISDHHSWKETWHLQLLQAKINAYLQFIESGEIFDQYPSAQGKDLGIEAAIMFEPNETGRSFLTTANEIIGNRGIEFQWRVVAVKSK